MNSFDIKCNFRANLKTDVTKHRIFWGISQVRSKYAIHSPDINSLQMISHCKSYREATGGRYRSNKKLVDISENNAPVCSRFFLHLVTGRIHFITS